MFIITDLLMIFISISIMTADRTIRRLNYKLDSDITSFVGDNIINYELTRIDSSSSTSILEIETEQWVHDCCVMITSQLVLRIRLKNDNNYPKITAYLRLRTPLSSIVMTGTGTLSTTNTIQSDSLMIEISGTCKAQLQVEIVSKLDVIVSGTGQVTMTGNVKGNGYIRLIGIGEFDGRACPMDTVIVDVTSVGTAYVVGNQAVDVSIGGVGLIYYHGPLRNQRVNGHGSINTLTNIDGKLSKSSNITMKLSINYYLILFFLYLLNFLL